MSELIKNISILHNTKQHHCILWDVGIGQEGIPAISNDSLRLWGPHATGIHHDLQTQRSARTTQRIMVFTFVVIHPIF